MAPLTISPSTLETYGPFPPAQAHTVIFSVGNDFEAHGFALSPRIDSIVSKEISLRTARICGAYYCGHIPSCTDELGPVAKAWSPNYMPFEEFFDSIIEFIRHHILELTFKPEKVLIIVTHNGNRKIERCAKDLTKGLEIPTRARMPAMSRLPERTDYEGYDTALAISNEGGEHAYIIEHALGAYLGCLDSDKLNAMNEIAAKNPIEALQNWPSIAGLGGYLECGDSRYEPLREMPALLHCLEDFKQRRQIPADPALGEEILNLCVDYYTTEVCKDWDITGG